MPKEHLKNCFIVNMEVDNALCDLTNDGEDYDELFDLLLIEKRRRGIHSKQLVFLGIADIADYWWCALRAFQTIEDLEAIYFYRYLEDRIRYSYLLGHINTIPKNRQDWLIIGDKITPQDIESLLDVQPISTDPNKELIEHYPTIGWQYQFSDYVIVGIPDGITDKFVYECKKTRVQFLVRFRKPVAFAQADLYGYFFNRKEKRVQIHIGESNKTETWQMSIDRNATIQFINTFLKEFQEYKNGSYPKAPISWKCKSKQGRICDYFDTCPLPKESLSNNPQPSLL